MDSKPGAPDKKPAAAGAAHVVKKRQAARGAKTGAERAELCPNSGEVRTARMVSLLGRACECLEAESAGRHCWDGVGGGRPLQQQHEEGKRAAMVGKLRRVVLGAVNQQDTTQNYDFLKHPQAVREA